MLYQSEFIVKNQKELINACIDSREKYLNFPVRHSSGDMTWDYRNYNFFSLSSGSYVMFDLYKELKHILLSNFGERRMWFQSWLNYHDSSSVLDWHTHEWDYHGYICIDPKNTITKFEDFDIVNKIGQIYLGPGKIKHKVECVDNFDDIRITIGFDISFNLDPMHGCVGMFPLA